MKKIIIIALVLTVLFAGNVFAQKGWALGGAFNFSWAGNTVYGGSGALCIKAPQLPIMFGVSATFIEPYTIGITADWWAYQGHLVGPVNLYIGPGIFLGLNMSGGDPAFGIRIPIGFQIYIVRAFEIFLEPAVAIGLMPILPQFSLQAALGFRFWF